LDEGLSVWKGVERDRAWSYAKVLADFVDERRVRGAADDLERVVHEAARKGRHRAKSTSV
jgi:hypothetical protein